MPRTPPSIPPPSLGTLADWQSGPRPKPLFDAELTVVTPLFGGSARARAVDPHHPVSGKGVRGQLRFWWRACFGPHYATAADLFDAESKLWGRTSGTAGAPSLVDVMVETVDRGRKTDAYMPGAGGFPRSAVYPFQPQRRTETPGAGYLQGVKFRLTVAPAPGATPTAAQEAQVLAALRAWVAFGGVGARTRRGCGALWCDDPLVRPQEPVGKWLRQQLAPPHIATGPRRLLVPQLSGGVVFVGDKKDTVGAWTAAVSLMEEFRQGPEVGRRPPKAIRTPPGTSYWPEPPSVRALQAHPDSRHLKAHPHQIFFPRADLGLPLNFQQMGDAPRLEGATDGRQRMASPFIIKPLAISEKQAVPLVLLLNAPHVWDAGTPGVRLAGHGSAPRTVPAAELHPTGRTIAGPGTVPPEANHLTTTNEARKAFLDYVRSKGPAWTEWTLP
jgi:CRISPR-associated protein Cmr1